MGGPGLIDGKYHEETNNFQICKFMVDGYEYTTAEGYFQAAKATCFEDREMVRKEGKNGLSAYSLGGKIKLRPDWEEVKVDEMYKGNFAKFEQNKEFVEKLTASKGPVRFLSSTDFWNYWNARIMERIRAEFRDTEEDKIVAEKIKELMLTYRKDPKNFKMVLVINK